MSSIANFAFGYCGSLTNVVIPNSVTNLGSGVFDYCNSLPSLFIPGNVTSIGIALVNGSSRVTAINVDSQNPAYTTEGGVLFDKTKTTLIEFPGGLTGAYIVPTTVTNIEDYAFTYCANLNDVIIENGVTHIGNMAFAYCTGITDITIPKTVTTFGSFAFYSCANLSAFYFEGDAPAYGDGALDYDSQAVVYYLAGKIGWGQTFAGRPTVQWKPQLQNGGAGFGLRTNQFGFHINWASGMTVVVEVCTNLASAIWSPVVTNTLTSRSFYFGDPQWTNYSTRFYRLRSL
jgi:hypothetical protein